MVIGITGQIGSGKSTAAAFLRRMGAAIIDADQIGRSVVDKDPVLRRRLVKRFGSQIMDRAGRLRRQKLAESAFADRDSRDALNRLVHPALLRELKREVKLKLATHDLVVIDAALLLDWNLDRFVDHTLVIHASQKVRLERLATRGVNPDDARARQRAQLPLAEYRQRADTFVMNSGTPDELKRKLDRFMNRLQRMKER